MILISILQKPFTHKYFACELPNFIVGQRLQVVPMIFIC